MNKSKIKLICIITVILLFIIALPTGVYAYKYNQYKSNFNNAESQLDSEKYDESINAFNDIGKTYFGKKNSDEIKKEIEKAEEYKENKKVYDEALQLFTDKKYLEAIESFKKIPADDTKRYESANKKINECKSLYIALNIENAKNEANSNKYDSAINYLSLVLAVDAENKDAANLTDEYKKAKEAAELKAKQEAELKAKQEAELKAKQEAEAKAKQEAAERAKQAAAVAQAQAAYVPTQVSGNEAIKNEFKKMGFVFQSDTKATYEKDSAGATIEYIENGGEKGSCWAIYTSALHYTYGDERLITNAMITIVGRESAANNLMYIDYALASDATFETPTIKARTYNQLIYVFIYLPK